MCGSELHSVAGFMTRAMAFMIEHAPHLFNALPEDLVRDIAQYWTQMEETHSEHGKHQRTCKSEDELDSSRSSLTHVRKVLFQVY